ncbi:glycoside hydrolase family 3 N-terminal domain-containing protein [Liquorilactobacillus satsumensis]|uniref:beta-glucosidase n=1 Tax=Liquorilactobacillus satsumensis DSM 16230 = JCM 12392 TaxID=1423801 RepID=A0A0R1V246_9LACO|nr:glycoside hydrolase family 3 N-terminal domain-containing protein [Liquorilactobacillus satsumensis]KRL96994.1 beta-glucosidase [Liquorilactobacillus satsumensis DSM 16230 = JCM 12392]
MTVRITELIDKMSLLEKVEQLSQLSADYFQGDEVALTGPTDKTKVTTEELYSVGSVLGISGADRARKIQTDYLQHSRLKIPLLFMADVVHGYKTIFPIPLGLASSFDPELVEQAAKIAAKEAAASGLHAVFAPMVDLVRDPRWGRVMEANGEDPFLNGSLAAASVRGFQGRGESLDENHVAACVKHFAAYGAAEGGREYNTVDISEWQFRDQYLEGYQRALAAGVRLVMTSFNTLFGVPATANQVLMRSILRKELGFNGVLISDWNAIGELKEHGVASSQTEAAIKALKAGVDIDMMSFAYRELGRQLEKREHVPQELITLLDEAVYRVLKLKEELGLFADPFRGMDALKEEKNVFTEDNLEIAQKAAEESTVLLENKENLLPLSPNTKITLLGPLAREKDLLGSWSWKGDSHENMTIAAALQSKFKKMTVLTESFTAEELDLVALAQKTAASQIVIVALGLTSDQSGEATSMTHLELPAEQLALLKALKKIGKKVVTLVVTGRPLVLTEVSKLSDAVLLPWFPGSRGAQAITEIIAGAINPSGKLPMSFPRSIGQIPLYYNSLRTGRPLTGEDSLDKENKYLSKYIDEQNSPLYCFGYGQSYATFEIKEVVLANNQVAKNDELRLEVTVANESQIDGQTVIQGYTHQCVAETARPVRELKMFKKIALKAKTVKKVEMRIPTARLAYVHQDLTSSVDRGAYELYVGFDANAQKKISFEII